jgi:hypothetical protein
MQNKKLRARLFVYEEAVSSAAAKPERFDLSNYIRRRKSTLSLSAKALPYFAYQTPVAEKKIR